MTHLRKLGFLNEAYAPSDLDDADLSLRAWEQYKLRVGAYWIDYLSPLHWGKSRSKESTMYIHSHIAKNGLRLLAEHRAYLESKIKHSDDITLPESGVDYLSPKPPFTYSLRKPYRIHRTDILRMLRLIRQKLHNK